MLSILWIWLRSSSHLVCLSPCMNLVISGLRGAAESASNAFPLALEKRFGGVPIIRYGIRHRMIPLGGYVKMLDERAEPVAPELRHYAFNNKTVGQRAAIIAAGPIANFLFAIFAYWLVFIHRCPWRSSGCW